MATLQYSVTLRNNQLDQFETTSGTAPLLRFYSGAMPATCATTASGTLLSEFALPTDWMAAASTGSKAKSGTWQGTGAVAAGAGTNIGYFRIYDSAGTTCHVQGDVTVTGGGGAMTVDNINIASGQTITVSTFTISAGNA